MQYLRFNNTCKYFLPNMRFFYYESSAKAPIKMCLFLRTEDACRTSRPSTTARTSTPTVCTSPRTTGRWIPTSLRWTLASPSTSLVSAPWRWWRSTPLQVSPPGSRSLSECKDAPLLPRRSQALVAVTQPLGKLRRLVIFLAGKRRRRQSLHFDQAAKS